MFGTHENEEDSMDSLVLRDDNINRVEFEDGDDSTMSSDLLSSLSTNFPAEQSQDPDHQDNSVRPKRKSGSLSELTLPGSLPLKKQRPESLLCQRSQTEPSFLETPCSAGDNSDHTDTIEDETEALCDTAPTSPRSPPPIISLVRTQGRSLIPDKENPPQDILDWVSTFSRWSHAERLLAIDQLIDRSVTIS